MIKKGMVSTADNVNKKARVTFPELDNTVSYELKVAKHIGELFPGDAVLVGFWSHNLTDGAIIAELG
jgi:cytochrome c oxidase assembly protein Cox11